MNPSRLVLEEEQRCMARQARAKSEKVSQQHSKADVQEKMDDMICSKVEPSSGRSRRAITRIGWASLQLQTARSPPASILYVEQYYPPLYAGAPVDLPYERSISFCCMFFRPSNDGSQSTSTCFFPSRFWPEPAVLLQLCSCTGAPALLGR